MTLKRHDFGARGFKSVSNGHLLHVAQGHEHTLSFTPPFFHITFLVFRSHTPQHLHLLHTH